VPSSKRDRIRNAIQEHLAGVLDAEARSPLDLLVLEVLANPGSRSDWSAALNKLINDTQERSGFWWQGIEFFVAMTKLCSLELADSLEHVVVRDNGPDPVGRASVYALLAECARPVSANLVWSDEDLRRDAPLLWLDLLLPLIPELENRQAIVLDAVSRREFDVSAFEMRLDAVREMGGANLGNWIRKLRQALPENQHAQYDDTLRDAGFTIPPSPPKFARSRFAGAPLAKQSELAEEFVQRIPANARTYPSYPKLAHSGSGHV